MICGKCHKEVKAGKFCENCGSVLKGISGMVECSYCHKLVREGKFCESCGETLNLDEIRNIHRGDEVSSRVSHGGSKGKSTGILIRIAIISVLLCVGGVMWKLYMDKQEDKNSELVNKGTLEVTEGENEEFEDEELENEEEEYGLKINQINTSTYPNIKLYMSTGGVENFDVSKISIEERNGSSYKPVNIVGTDLRVGDEKINLNLVIDNSKAMGESGIMDDFKLSTSAILESLDYSNTHAGIVSVNSKVTMNNYITNNYEALNNALTALVPGGERAIYDGIITSLEELNKNDGAKLLVAFVTEEDTASKHSLRDVVDRANELNIPLNIIKYNSSDSSMESKNLKSLADETNGEFYSISDMAELKGILDELLESLRNSHVITFETTIPAEVGDELDFQVSYVDSDFTVTLDGSTICMSEIVNNELVKYNEEKEKILNLANGYIKNAKGRYSIYYGDVDKSSPVIINDEPIRSASIIKVFIMIEVMDQIDKGLLDGNKFVAMTSPVGGTGIIQYEPIGSEYTIYELLEHMMINSDNTAANMLIDEVGGVHVVNEKIKALGCVNSRINRKLLDMDALKNGKDNYVTVYDMGNILTKIYNKQCISEEADTYMLQLMYRNKNRSKIPYELPEGVKTYNKTGEFDEFGVQNDVAIIETNKGAYVLCVLTDDGHTEEEIEIIRDLSRDIYNEFIKE